MRRISGAVLGGVIAVAVAGCGGSTRHSAPPIPTSVPHPPAQTVTRPPAPKPSPALLALGRGLRAALRAAGPSVGVAVYDLTTRQMLYTVRGEVTRPPASVEKLYTSVAVLTDLGPATTLSTSVLGYGQLRPGGVWRGSLYLRGGGDPTFGDGTFNRAWEEGYGPTATELAAQLRRAGIRRVTGWVIGDPSLFDSRRGGPATRFAPDIPDLGGQLAALTYDHGSSVGRLSPGAFAARELVLTLRRSGIRARAAAATGITPSGAQPLAAVNSPPVSVLLKLTDVPSDDFFAEMLTKQLGVRFGGAGTTAAGAAVVAGVVSRYGLTPTIVDGSGLSRRDHTSPDQVVDLLRAVWGTTTGRLLLAALPVVGVTGTVQRLAVHTPAQGRCQAKTGTLDYVTNLAGYCHSRGGQVLAFAVFLDGPSNLEGSILLGRMVASIARY